MHLQKTSLGGNSYCSAGHHNWPTQRCWVQLHKVVLYSLFYTTYSSDSKQILFSFIIINIIIPDLIA